MFFNMHVEYFEWCKCYRRMQETPIYANRRESSRWWPLPTLTQIHRVFFETMTRNWHCHVEYTCCSLSPATSVNTLIPVKASWVMTIARCRAHSISFLWNIGKPRHDPSLISSKQPGKGPALLNARRWSTCVLNQWIITHPSPACRLAWNFLSSHARETSWLLNGVGKKQKHERKTKNLGKAIYSGAWQEQDNGGLGRLGLMKTSHSRPFYNSRDWVMGHIQQPAG